MVTLKRKFITVGELWFDEQPDTTPVDLLLYYHWSQPGREAYSREFYSIEIPLTPAPEQLLGAMKKDTRYEITRAGKDALTVDFWTEPDEATLDSFCTFFDAFAASRGLSSANRPWLSEYARAGQLTLSCASLEGVPLVWHSYYRGPRWARLLMSASDFRSNPDKAFRNLVGRANRFLHWNDMLQFKDSGVDFYDLGGWYEGSEDQQKLRINQFKEEFGGAVNKRYYSMHPVTLKGQMFLWAHAKAGPGDQFLHMV